MRFKKTAYFLFVFIPLCLLYFLGVFLETDKTQSERERRELAPLPDNPLAELQAFEAYLSDHIWGRELLLDIYFKSGIGMELGTKSVLIGKNGWMFQNEFHNKDNLHNLLSYANKVDFSKEDLKKIIANLKRMKQFCDNHHIKMYLMFPPDKHRIYARYMPSYILRKNRPGLSKRVAVLVPSDMHFVPLEDALLRQSMDETILLYYKTESHWTEDGAYLAYRLLMAQIQKDFPDIQIAKPEDFNISKRNDIFTPYWPVYGKPRWTKGNLFLSGLKSDETKYTHYDLKPEYHIDVTWDIPFFTSFNPNKHYNVYLIGDSYGAYLNTFLANTFKNVYFYRFNPNGKKFGIDFLKRQEDMLSQQTDILILSISDLKLIELLRAFDAV